MNKSNDWKGLLRLANRDLKPYGAKLVLDKDQDDYYSLDIEVKGKLKNFAENYVEDELSALINDAWAHARAAVKSFLGKRNKAAQTVTITCYNKVEVLPRKQAINKYIEAMAASEGSEHERYETIYFQLIAGLDKVSDQADWREICRKPFNLR